MHNNHTGLFAKHISIEIIEAVGRYKLTDSRVIVAGQLKILQQHDITADFIISLIHYAVNNRITEISRPQTDAHGREIRKLKLIQFQAYSGERTNSYSYETKVFSNGSGLHFTLTYIPLIRATNANTPSGISI